MWRLCCSRNYGIGIFDGIHEIALKEYKDYIKIKYAGTDVLYVPVNSLILRLNISEQDLKRKT